MGVLLLLGVAGAAGMATDPVYASIATTLLGGLVRDKMNVYSWVGGDRPADVVLQ